MVAIMAAQGGSSGGKSFRDGAVEAGSDRAQRQFRAHCTQRGVPAGNEIRAEKDGGPEQRT